MITCLTSQTRVPWHRWFIHSSAWQGGQRRCHQMTPVSRFCGRCWYSMNMQLDFFSSGDNVYRQCECTESVRDSFLHSIQSAMCSWWVLARRVWRGAITIETSLIKKHFSMNGTWRERSSKIISHKTRLNKILAVRSTLIFYNGKGNRPFTHSRHTALRKHIFHSCKNVPLFGCRQYF